MKDIVRPATAEDDKGTVIYGDITYNRCFYERIVLMENGDLLATWCRVFPIASDWKGMKSFLFYKSSDRGKSWSRLSELNPDDYGMPTDKQGMPGLFVFPRELSGYPAGTILFAANDWSVESSYCIHIWRSSDNGKTWELHGHLAPRESRSVWEPEFIISRDGRLICYYSDERKTGYDQCLALEISDDGGRTWKDYRIIIGRETPGWTVGMPCEWRPGMPRVIRLLNGKYLMAFENINRYPEGGITIKYSEDAINWGDPAEPGIPVAAEERRAFQCPAIALIDDGSTYGKIFLRGMNDDCLPEQCFMSDDNGQTWQLVNAPLVAVRNEETGSNWSSSFLALGNKLIEINNPFNGIYNEICVGIGTIKNEEQ